MNKKYNLVADYMAKVGYETMFDIAWDDLPEHSIGRELWHKIALNMLAELWRVYKVNSPREQEFVIES